MTATATVQASAVVMDLLAHHVPLALLLDLAADDGPWSASIYDDERYVHSDSRIWDTVRCPGIG